MKTWLSLPKTVVLIHDPVVQTTVLMAIALGLIVGIIAGAALLSDLLNVPLL